MRDNLVVMGVPEMREENAEEKMKSYIQTQLKLPEEKVKSINSVHRMGVARPGNCRP